MSPPSPTRGRTKSGPTTISLPPTSSSKLAPGPASTPRIDHHPPPLQVDQLFPLLRPTSASRRNSSLAHVETHDREEEEDEEDEDEIVEVLNRGMLLWGYALVTFSFTCFVLGVWAIAIGPFVEPLNIKILDAMTRDTHYKYLFVFLVPVTLYAVIINWWGLKIFRHA